ncbi:uncharacterized protein LOC134243377, partial [Saccostrea cucullata]|uniref:uncharacterized protein LOC134243377 n=1 Tax=Saccostrea cuccullata TaxID=36930 RepID=UPI002ED1C188
MHKSLKEHLNVKRRFAIGFNDNEGIESIKLSILDVVGKLDHWGEELPRSWAMFETFFQEKKKLKILKIDALIAFNEALPEGIKLQMDDINVMLQFFHDIREILYFAQVLLREIVILDVQWFAYAFKNVITDKNHAQEDLFEFTAEWDKFNETGELDETLLCAIWKMNNNGYIEHKEDIMLYMERLGLLAKMSDNKWYVPCMNKVPFPVECFSSYPASSILCYTFDFLPAGIFHRLVATCMQIPWEVFADNDKGCIYQTVTIFVFPDLHHNIMLGMTQKEIQLQVFVAEGELDVLTCHQVREKIEHMLYNLSNTFHKTPEFQVAFKCKSKGFCDSKESSVISESKFTQATFQCPSCPANKKHCIITEDIKKYWEQVPEEDSKIKTDKSGNEKTTLTKPMKDTTAIELPSTDESSENFDKIMKLLHVGVDAIRICFDKFFPKESLEKTLKDNETDMRRGQFRFQPPQLEILFPPEGGSNSVTSLSMDISIMYKLLRNYSDIPPPGNGWGKEPKVEYITESDDIERIRLYRNKYSHVSGSNPVLKDDVFNVIWTDLYQ